MTVGLFAMELAKAAHPEQSSDSDLKRDIRAAMRQKAEGEYRAALAGAIQSGLVAAHSPIGRVPATLMQGADFNDPLWLIGDAAQVKARELFGIAQADAEIVPTASEAQGLASGDMAALLDGIERNAAEWRGKLADPPGWLMGARLSRGARGKRGSSTWDPVQLAMALQGRGVPVARLRRVFEHPLAAAWRDEWARNAGLADDYGI
jgi:hypothetical protein